MHESAGPARDVSRRSKRPAAHVPFAVGPAQRGINDARRALAAVREQLNAIRRGWALLDEAVRGKIDRRDCRATSSMLAERHWQCTRGRGGPADPRRQSWWRCRRRDMQLPVERAPMPTSAEPSTPSSNPRCQHGRRRLVSGHEDLPRAGRKPYSKPSPSHWHRDGNRRSETAVPVSRLLAAFMEEKNIRWGELVGGLLIVGCSIALVISFWSEIAARPLLKFGLFNGVTAALFGAGLYTDRRWKIHTTSHGVLMIATLLVPLNFLAIAAFTQASPPTDLAVARRGGGVARRVFAAGVSGRADSFAGRRVAVGRGRDGSVADAAHRAPLCRARHAAGLAVRAGRNSDCELSGVTVAAIASEAAR